jgi:hypothetical protein
MTITAQDLVHREVHYCVSGLVHTLASDIRNVGHKGDLSSLCEQAQELCYPIEDYEEALMQEGFQVRHDAVGYYILSNDLAAYEDTHDTSTGYAPKDYYSPIKEAARAYCEFLNIEPYQREIFEHWIVSDWLAEKLAAKGERIDTDFAGMTVWGRTTTGQAIYMDSVIQEIHQHIGL